MNGKAQALPRSDPDDSGGIVGGDDKVGRGIRGGGIQLRVAPAKITMPCLLAHFGSRSEGEAVASIELSG